MFFVRYVAALLNKALLLCDRAICAADKAVELANGRKAKLEERMKAKEDHIEQAERERWVAENIKNKIVGLAKDSPTKYID